MIQQVNRIIEQSHEKIHTTKQRKKQAVERVRRLANGNIKNSSIKLKISYESCEPKADTSLLTVNR